MKVVISNGKKTVNFITTLSNAIEAFNINASRGFKVVWSETDEAGKKWLKSNVNVEQKVNPEVQTLTKNLNIHNAKELLSGLTGDLDFIKSEISRLTEGDDRKSIITFSEDLINKLTGE